MEPTQPTDFGHDPSDQRIEGQTFDPEDGDEVRIDPNTGEPWARDHDFSRLMEFSGFAVNEVFDIYADELAIDQMRKIGMPIPEAKTHIGLIPSYLGDTPVVTLCVMTEDTVAPVAIVINDAIGKQLLSAEGTPTVDDGHPHYENSPLGNKAEREKILRDKQRERAPKPTAETIKKAQA